MKTAKKIESFVDIMRVRFTGRPIPVAIRWTLTHKCTSRCIYCNIYEQKTPELTTDQIRGLLDQVAAAGTKRISFSGGDPLVRKDFGEIIDHAVSLGISCSINSCGALVVRNLDAIRKLDLVKISLDGPEKIHDLQKGKGSFRRAMDAADALRKAGVRYTFACTIAKYSVDHLVDVLRIAEQHNTLVAFQPLKELYMGVHNIDDISPDLTTFKREVRKLIDIKRSGNRHIRNSLRGLRHIWDWPNYERLECAGGKIFCMIETDGRVTPCDRNGYDMELPNALEHGFRWSMDHLPTPNCKGCGFCGALELNYVYNLRPDVLPIINKIS